MTGSSTTLEDKGGEGLTEPEDKKKHRTECIEVCITQSPVRKEISWLSPALILQRWRRRQAGERRPPSAGGRSSTVRQSRWRRWNAGRCRDRRLPIRHTAPAIITLLLCAKHVITAYYAPAYRGHFGISRSVILSVPWHRCRCAIGTLAACSLATAGHQRCADPSVSAKFSFSCVSCDVRRSLDRDSAATLVRAFVTSRIDYGNALLANAPKIWTEKLQRVLNAAARVITGTRKFDSGVSHILHHDLLWLDVPQRVIFKLCMTV